MRIDDTLPPAAPTESGDSETDPNKSDDQKEGTSPFSRVLAKKQEGRQEGASSKGVLGGRKEDMAALATPPQVPSEFAQHLKPEAIASKQTVEIPPQLQQLVHEISVVAGKHQAHIEMNSNVLKGLQVHIESQNGAVSIQFLTTSPAITTLLANNMSLLSKGLEVRGVNVSDIRIDNTETSKSSFSGGSTQTGSRPSGGGQGGKR